MRRRATRVRSGGRRHKRPLQRQKSVVEGTRLSKNAKKYFQSMWRCRQSKYRDLEMEFLLKKLEDRRTVFTNMWLLFIILFFFFQV